jgi:hypothetical protein
MAKIDCRYCCEKEAVWVRSGENILGWKMSFYTCENCGSHFSNERPVEKLKTINPLDFIKLNQAINP